MNIPEARARALDILRVDVAVAVLVEALGERLLEYLGEDVESEQHPEQDEGGRGERDVRDAQVIAALSAEAGVYVLVVVIRAHGAECVSA